MFEDISEKLSPCADWRNPEHYRHLLEHDSVGWAGEWLRRNPEFLADLQRAPCHTRSGLSGTDGDVHVVSCTESCPLARWGVRCCRMDDNGMPMSFWLPQHNPQVLVVDAVADETDGFDLRRCSLLKAALRGKQKTHLLFSDGARSLQVVVREAFDLDKPISFRCTLNGWQEFDTKLVSLQRLCRLYRQGRLVKSLFPKEQRAQRWIETLRFFDGLQSGAGRRDIAAAILGPRAAGDGWEDGARARVQRLVRSAKRVVTDSGHLVFLHRTEKREAGFGLGKTKH